MAMESQGVFIRRASTAILEISSVTTVMDVTATAIHCASGIDFAGLGLTTNDVFLLASDINTVYMVMKATATALDIYGSFASTGSATQSLNVYTMGQIGEITDFNGPGGAAAVIDVSHLGSTAKEKLIGLRDEGQLSMSLNYNATDAGQAGLRTDRAARVRNHYDMVFRDTIWSASALPSRAYFWAYCLQFAITGAVDDKIAANAVLEITGAVEYTTRVTT